VVPTTPVTRRSKSPSFTILTLLYKHGVVNVGSVLVYKSHRAVVTKDVWLDSADEKFPSVHQWLLAVDPNIILNDGDWHRFVQIDSDAASGNGLTLADHSASILSSKLRASKPAAVATRAVRDTPTPPPSPLPAIAAAGGADSPDWQKRPAAGDGVVRKRQRRRSPSPTPATATSSTATTASTSADNWHSSRRVVSSAVKQRTLEEMLAKPIVTKLVVEAPTIAEKEDVVNETPPRLPTQRATLYSAKKRAAAVASEEVLDNASNSASAMPPPPLPVSTKKKQKSSKSRSKRSPPPVPAAAAVERDEASEHSAEPVVILGSNLTSVQLLELRQLAGRLGFEVVDEWSGRVTHLVMPRCDGERVVVRRTIKYLYALMSGIWILEWAWVEACLRRIGTSPRRRLRRRATRTCARATRRASCDSARCRSVILLSEFVVYVHTKLSPDEGAPPREAIAELAQLCGAKLINEPPSVSDVRRWTNKQRSQRYTSVLIVCDDASLGARGVDVALQPRRQQSRPGAGDSIHVGDRLRVGRTAAAPGAVLLHAERAGGAALDCVLTRRGGSQLKWAQFGARRHELFERGNDGGGRRTVDALGLAGSWNDVVHGARLGGQLDVDKERLDEHFADGHELRERVDAVALAAQAAKVVGRQVAEAEEHLGVVVRVPELVVTLRRLLALVETEAGVVGEEGLKVEELDAELGVDAKVGEIGVAVNGALANRHGVEKGDAAHGIDRNADALAPVDERVVGDEVEATQRLGDVHQSAKRRVATA
jgi:hypothetical protein